MTDRVIRVGSLAGSYNLIFEIIPECCSNRLDLRIGVLHPHTFPGFHIENISGVSCQE